jgi:hypothetical protein
MGTPQRKAQIEQMRGFLVYEGVLARASLTAIHCPIAPDVPADGALLEAK